MSASATLGVVGGTLALTAAVVVPQGRNVAKVEFLEGGTLLGQDTNPPYSFNYSLDSAGIKILTAKAYDDSSNPVVSVSNVVAITVTTPASSVGPNLTDPNWMIW